MKAAVASHYGGPEAVTLQDIPEPALLPGTARVAVRAAAVNFPDLLVLAGRYQANVATPYTPGCEFCGEVLEVAHGVQRVRPGDIVFGLATHGAFAEQVVLDSSRLTPIRRAQPPNLNQLAAFGVTYTTAYHALRTFADTKPGEHVTVLGASGGVGLAAVDIATAIGARPIGVGGDPDKLAVAAHYGATIIPHYGGHDLKEQLNQLTDGGADVVVDPVGGAYAEPSLRAMRWGGRFVVIGFADGEIPRIPLNLVLLKGIRVMGFENRTILQHLPEKAEAHRAEVLDLFLDGRLRPHIGTVYPLSEARAALTQLAQRRAVGKVVIEVAR